MRIIHCNIHYAIASQMFMNSCTLRCHNAPIWPTIVQSSFIYFKSLNFKYFNNTFSIMKMILKNNYTFFLKSLSLFLHQIKHLVYTFHFINYFIKNDTFYHKNFLTMTRTTRFIIK